MGAHSQEQLYRIIEPLVDAGLDAEQIRNLMFRLAFDVIVSDGIATVTCVTDVVRDQPAEVQAAWMRVIGRMITRDASSL